MAVFVQTTRRLARRGAVVAGVEAKQTAVNHSVNFLLRPVSLLLYNYLKEEHRRATAHFLLSTSIHSSSNDGSMFFKHILSF